MAGASSETANQLKGESAKGVKAGASQDANRNPGSVLVSSYSDLDPKLRSELEDKLKANGLNEHLYEGKSVFNISVSDGEIYVPFNRLGKVCAFFGTFQQKLQLRIREDGTVSSASVVGAENQPVPIEVYHCTFTPQKSDGQPTQVATIFFPAVASR